MSLNEFDLPLRNYDIKSPKLNLKHINNSIAEKQYYSYKPKNLNAEFSNNCAKEALLQSQENNDYKILRSPSPIYKGQLKTERVTQKSSLKLSPRKSPIDLNLANESLKAVQNTDRVTDSDKFKIILNQQSTSNNNMLNNNTLTASNISKRNLQSICRSRSAIGNIHNTSVSYSNINMPHQINFPLQMPHPSFNKVQYLQTGLNLTNLNDSLEHLNMSSSQMAGTFMAQPQYQCTNCGFQIQSSATNEGSIDYISKINDLKKILRKKEQEYQKQNAILKQQVHLLEMQATEYEQREIKMKRNHESMLKAYKTGGNFDFEGQLGTISELETLRLSRDELKKSKDNLESTVMDLQDQLKQKDFEINNLVLTNDDKDILNERKVQDLQLDKRNLENKIRRLENQLQRSDQNELTIKTQNQQREIEKLKDKLQESSQEHTQEVIKLRKCQDEFQEQMKYQQQQLDFSHTQLQQKEIQRQNDQNQIERLEEQVKTYERQVEEMEQQVEDLTLQLGVKEQNLMQMQQQIQNLLQQQSQQMIALDGTQIEELTNRFTQLTGRKIEQSPQNTYRADLEIQRLADENDYLVNQIQSQKSTILNQQEQIKQYLNNENQTFKEFEFNKDQIFKQKEEADKQIFQLQSEIKGAEIQRQQLQNNYVEQCSKFKEQIISLKNQYEQLQQQHQQELMNKQYIIEKLENENRNYSLQVSLKKFETDKKDTRCQQEIDYKNKHQNILASPLLMKNPSPNNYTEIQVQQQSNLQSTSKQSLIYVNGQSCSASQQNISVMSGNVINNPSMIQNAMEGLQTANMSHYQHISRLHDNDESMITISGGGNVIYPSSIKNQEGLKLNDAYKNMGQSQMSQLNQNNTLNLNWSINHHKNMPSMCLADAAKSALQEVSAIQGTGITVQDQEDDARHLFRHHHQASTVTNQNLMPTYQSSIATIEGFTNGLVDINKFNNQQTHQYENQQQFQNQEQIYEIPNDKVEIASSELDLLYSCQKIIDAASSMKCIKCERIFYTTDFYDHIIVQRECIIFESENGQESNRNQGTNLIANKINNDEVCKHISQEENFENQYNEIEGDNYDQRSSNCNINMNENHEQADGQLVASYNMPLQINDQNNLMMKQHQQIQKSYYYKQSDPLQVEELNNFKESDNKQKEDLHEIQNHNLEIMNNENLIEEIRPSYLLSADPVTHVQPNYQNNKIDNQNFDIFLQNKRISSLSPFGGKTEQQNQNSTSGGDFSKKQIHSNSISKTGKAKKYCNNYQTANGIGKSGSNGGLQVSQYSQGAKNPLSNNNGQQNAQEFGSRSGMAYSRGTGMTGTVNSNILMSLSRSNTSRSNFSGQDNLKDKSNINNNGSSSPSMKPKTNGIFMNDDDNIRYLAANYHREKSGIPLSNNPNTTVISKNNGVYTDQNMVTDSVATNEQFFYDNAEAARILLAISDRSPTNFSRFEQQLNGTGAANSKRTNTKRELQANDLLALKSIKSVGKSSQENLNTEERSFNYKNSTNLINKHMQFNRQFDQNLNQKNCILSESLRDILNTNDDNMAEEEQIDKLGNENAYKINQAQDQNYQKTKQKNLVHKAEMQGYLDSKIQADKNKDQLMELEKLYELDTSRFEEEYSNLTSSKKKILLKQLIDDEPNEQEQSEIDAIMLHQQINLQTQFFEQNPSDKLKKNHSRNGVDSLIHFQQNIVSATQNTDTQNTYTESNSNFNQFNNVNTKSEQNKFNKSLVSVQSLSQKNMMTESISKQTDQHQEILDKMGSMVENSSQNSKKNQVKKIGLNLAPILKKQQIQKIPASRISIVDPNIVSNNNYQIKKELIEKAQQKPKFDLSQKFEQLKQLKSGVNTLSQQIKNNQLQMNKSNTQTNLENQLSNRDAQGQQVRKLKLKRNSSKGFQMSKKQLSIDIANSNILSNNEINMKEEHKFQQQEFLNNDQLSQEIDQKAAANQILINDQGAKKSKVQLGFDNMKNTQTQKNEKNQQIKLLKEIIKVSKSPQNQYNQFLFGQNKYESQNSFRCIKSENENIFPVSDNNQIQSPMSSYFPSQNKKSNVIQVNNKNIEGTIIAEQKSYAHLSENHNAQKRKIQHFRSNIVNQNAIGQISTMSQVSKGSNPSLSQQIEPQMLLNKSDSHNSPLARRIVQNSCGYQVSQGEDRIEKTVEQSQSKQITQVGQIKKQNSLTCLQPQSRLSSEKQKDLDTSAAFDINFGSEINSPVSKKMGFAGSTIGKTGGAIGQRVNQSQKKDLIKTGTNFMPKITEEDQMASIYQNQSINLNEDCNDLRELSERNSAENLNGQESQRHMLGKQKRFVPTLIVNQDDKIFMEERIQKYNCNDDDENLNDDFQFPPASNREQMNKVQKHNSKNYLSHQVKIDDSLKHKNKGNFSKDQNQIISTLQFTNPSYNTQSQIIYNKNSKGSPHRKNTDYIRQSILQSSDRRNVSYKSNEGKEIFKKHSQLKQEKANYQKFYGVEEQEFPSFLDDQDFDEFSQNIEGTMKKQNTTLRAEIQNMQSSDLLETFQNLQQNHNHGDRQLLKNLQSQILNQPQKQSYENKRSFQNQELNQQVQRDTIKAGQNEVYSNPPCIQSSKQMMSNLMFPSKIRCQNQTYSIQNSNLSKQGFSLAATTKQLHQDKKYNTKDYQTQNYIISQSQDIKQNMSKNNMFDQRKMSQKEIYFNDSDPRQINKMVFNDQSIDCDEEHISKIMFKHPLQKNESQIFGTSKIMGGMHFKQVMPAKTPNNEHLMQTVRSDFNSFKNYSEINDHGRTSKNKSNSVFAKNISSTIQKSSRNNVNSKYQNSNQTIGMQDSQAQFLGNSQIKSSNEFFSQIYPGEQAAKSFNNVKFDNNLDKNSQTQSFQEGFNKKQENFFIQKDQLQTNVRMNQQAYGQSANSSNYHVYLDKK